jgi:hypothetical protein
MITAHDARADDADAQAAAAEILSLTHNAKSPPATLPYPSFPLPYPVPTGDREARQSVHKLLHRLTAHFFSNLPGGYLID